MENMYTDSCDNNLSDVLVALIGAIVKVQQTRNARQQRHGTIIVRELMWLSQCVPPPPLTRPQQIQEGIEKERLTLYDDGPPASRYNKYREP